MLCTTNCSLVALLLPEVGSFSYLHTLTKTTLLTYWGYFWVLWGAQLSSFIPATPAQSGAAGSHGLHHPWAEVNICFHLKRNQKATGLGNWSAEDTRSNLPDGSSAWQ